MKYKSQRTQHAEEVFRPSLDQLPKSNRWVQLGDSIPWVEIERLYNLKLNKHKGTGDKPARLVVGALIIKHKLNLTDEETVLAIQENPYMQYMLGLSEFNNKPVFDPSLFVTIRDYLQIEDLCSFALTLMKANVKANDSSRNGENSVVF